MRKTVDVHACQLTSNWGQNLAQPKNSFLQHVILVNFASAASLVWAHHPRRCTISWPQTDLAH